MVALLTRTPGGAVKEILTTADSYVVELHRPRTGILAAFVVVVFGFFIGFSVLWFLVLAANYADCVASRQNGVR